MIQITAYPGELIKLVIISLDELDHPTSDNIQIQGSVQINVSTFLSCIADVHVCLSVCLSLKILCFCVYIKSIHT